MKQEELQEKLDEIRKGLRWLDQIIDKDYN